MKNNRPLIFGLFIVLAIVLVLYFANSNNSQRYQWNENHRADSDQPYGVAFLRKLLESSKPKGGFIFSDKKPVKEVLAGVTIKTDYVFIGQSLYLDEADQDTLLHFIEKGNDAFVTSIEPPAALLERIYNAECTEAITLDAVKFTTVNMNFYNDGLKTKKGYYYAYHYFDKDMPYFWNFVKRDAFCDSTKAIAALGYFENDHVNFFKLPYGKGNLYVHTNPLVFTNYFLVNENKLEYVTSVFSHLNGKKMVWDEVSKVPFLNNNNDDHSNPLYYILQQPALKYAWWLMLLTVFLYILFVAKRTQRIIPVLEPKTNTSLEFVNLISALYYQNGNHLDMARKRMKYFQYFIRSKYGIHIQTPTDDLIMKLAEKSKVNSGDIKLIFDINTAVEKESYYNITAHRLEELYNAIERFYKQCK